MNNKNFLPLLQNNKQIRSIDNKTISSAFKFTSTSGLGQGKTCQLDFAQEICLKKNDDRHSEIMYLFKMGVFLLRIGVVKPHYQLALEALLVILIEQRCLRMANVEVTVINIKTVL